MANRIEDEPMKELLRYIDQTYKEHYSKKGNDPESQTIHEIIASGDGVGFSKGNVRKYLNRYGHKGSVNDAREDILKLLHYGLYWLVSHDFDNGKGIADVDETD